MRPISPRALRDLGLPVVPPQTNIFYVEIPARHVAPLTEHLLRAESVPPWLRTPGS